MKKLAIAIGMSAAVACVSPALALEAADSNDTFKAIASIPESQQPTDKDMLTDSELAAVEGSAPIGQVGLVNVGVGNVVNNSLNDNDVRVLNNNNIPVNANVSVLSAGGQLIRTQ